MAGPYAKETLNLPENTPLLGTGELGPVSYVFVADEAFLLRGYILRRQDREQRESSTSGFPMPGEWLSAPLHHGCCIHDMKH